MEPREICELSLIFLTAFYGFMIVVFTTGLIITFKNPHVRMKLPAGFVSVIIPVRNEAENIIRILEEIRIQDFPPASMEVIVTDDHSEDATVDLASRFAAEHQGFQVIIVNSNNSDLHQAGKKAAIERAVAIARGDILLLTDADTFRGPGWVYSMVSCFGNTGIQMVLGPVYFTNEQNLLQKIQSLEFMGLMGTTAGSAALGYPVMCNGANLAYRRDAFTRTGGFSAHLRYRSGDDQFMMSAVRKQYGKGSLLFNADPDARVGTVPESTLKGFLNQRFRWVSKSRGYRDPVVIMVGMVTWLTHVMLLAGMVSGLFMPHLLSLSLFLWLFKVLLEYPVVWTMARFFGNGKLSGYYFIAQVFQLVYVPLAGLLGLFLPYSWKGRRVG